MRAAVKKDVTGNDVADKNVSEKDVTGMDATRTGISKEPPWGRKNAAGSCLMGPGEEPSQGTKRTKKVDRTKRAKKKKGLKQRRKQRRSYSAGSKDTEPEVFPYVTIGLRMRGFDSRCGPSKALSPSACRICGEVTNPPHWGNERPLAKTSFGNAKDTKNEKNP